MSQLQLLSQLQLPTLRSSAVYTSIAYDRSPTSQNRRFQLISQPQRPRRNATKRARIIRNAKQKQRRLLSLYSCLPVRRYLRCAARQYKLRSSSRRLSLFYICICFACFVYFVSFVSFESFVCFKSCSVSSVASVGGWKGIDQVPETRIHDLTAAANMDYGQSKLIAECLLDKASEISGVRSAICRVGMVAGPVEQQIGRRMLIPTAITEWETAPSSLLPQARYFKRIHPSVIEIRAKYKYELLTLRAVYLKESCTSVHRTSTLPTRYLKGLRPSIQHIKSRWKIWCLNL